MYSVNKGKEIVADIQMIERVVDSLNKKFDPTESYHKNEEVESEMFEFHLKTDASKREAWEITFIGFPVVSGSLFGFNYADCQEEEYLTLETRNELKITMLATTKAINYIDKFINYIVLSDTSTVNKQKWAETIKRSVEM